MASAINDAFPVQGNPTTQSVRDNFTIAKNEITNLQSQVAALLASGASPGGPAGGVLAGTYPDPGFAPMPVFGGGLGVQSPWADILLAGGTFSFTFTSSYPSVSLNRSRGSIAAPEAIEEGDPVGGINSQCYSGTRYVVGPQLLWSVAGPIGGDDNVPMSVELNMQNGYELPEWVAWKATYQGVVTVGKNDAIRTDGTTVELAVPLVLPAAPVGDMEAATKAYVDALIATVGALEARIARLEKPTR